MQKIKSSESSNKWKYNSCKTKLIPKNLKKIKRRDKKTFWPLKKLVKKKVVKKKDFCKNREKKKENSNNKQCKRISNKPSRKHKSDLLASISTMSIY